MRKWLSWRLNSALKFDEERAVSNEANRVGANIVWGLPPFVWAAVDLML